MQYRNGIIVSTAATTVLKMGFIPDRFTIRNYTKTAAQTGVGFSEWIKGVVADDKALISTYAAGVPTVSLLASAGVTPVSVGALYSNTNYTITGIVIATGVVTVSAIGSIVNGDIVTISNVVGTTQLNTNRYLVTAVSGNTFKLADLFGTPISMLAFGTYVSGGIANIISTPIVAPVVSAVTGLVTTQGQPPGNQYDLGYAGVSLGTGVLGTALDVLYWEAFLMTPTGY